MLSVFLNRLVRHPGLLAVAMALLTAVCAEGLYRSGQLAGAEYFYSDTWHRLAGVRQKPSHVALVMIDDSSLSALPDEPLAFWTPHFATALETLERVGARVVAIDFIFSVSPERWLESLGGVARDRSRAYDQAFRTQINRGKSLLAGYLLGEGNSVNDFVLPNPDFLLALPELDIAQHVGLANLVADADSAVRRFRLRELASAFADQEGLPNFSFGGLAAAQASAQERRSTAFVYGQRTLAPEEVLPIAYIGPPGAFAAISFASLLRPDAAQLPEIRALAGKVVVIGTGYAGMNDVHPTPYSTGLGRSNSLMAGPEIQANIIETLLSGRFIDEAGAAARGLIFLLAFAGLAWLGLRLRPWQTVLMVLAALLASAAAAYFLFTRDYLFPVAHLHAGMVLTLLLLMLTRLTREARERARLGQMFGRYVSGQVMDALLASPELPELGGQLRPVSVLFSDIRNFTTISEKLSAREVVEMLNAYFEQVCTVLLAEGASIDKFIGDAIMAEFGAPLAQADHARRALHAAVAMHRVAQEFRQWMAQRFADRGLPEFEVGIGIHSGDAVVGNIGSSARMEYTAIGDTVNIASRLEGKTKETGCAILASRETVSLAGAGIVTGVRHSLQVKGRSQPVEAFEIVSVC